MTRETKIGLLVAVGIILLIGIVVSDHFAPANRQKPANLVQEVRELEPAKNPQRQNNSPNFNRRHAIDRAVDANFGRGAGTRRGNRLEVPEPAGNPIEAAMEQTRVAPTPPPTPSRPAHRLQGEGYRIETGIDGVPELVLDRAAGGARPSPPSAPQNKFHTLQEHETLSDVAAKYYGSPKHWTKVYAANKDRIANPDFVRAGVRLKIPVAQTSAPAPRRHAAVQVASAAGTASHTIREDETLSDIAERYYGSPNAWAKLYKLNKDRIANPDRIRAGTVIRVPKR